MPATQVPGGAVWERLRREAAACAQAEPLLAGYLHDTILRHRSLESALSFFLAGKLASPHLAAVTLRDLFSEALTAAPEIGKESGDRHPKVGHGVLIGAGAIILGNIRIGDGSKIAAGNVVLSEVPPHSTVAGVPARVVGKPKAADPARQMDQLVEYDFCI
jgi:hypothetical protein